MPLGSECGGYEADIAFDVPSGGERTIGDLHSPLLPTLKLTVERCRFLCRDAYSWASIRILQKRRLESDSLFCRPSSEGFFNFARLVLVP